MSRKTAKHGAVNKGSRAGQTWRLVNAYAEARYRDGKEGYKPEAAAQVALLRTCVIEALKASTLAEVEQQLTAAGIRIDYWVAG